jgi:hypothetical protein
MTNYKQHAITRSGQLVLLVLLLLCARLHGQIHNASRLTVATALRQNVSCLSWRVGMPPARIVKKLHFAVGIAAGQETFFGAPKFGFYALFPAFQKEAKSPKYGFKSGSFYAGVEGSLFVVFIGIFSVSGTCGLVMNRFTLDHALTCTLVSDPSSNNTTYATSNPKLGVQLGPVWLKAGPSFLLRGPADWGDWMLVGNVRLNVDLVWVAGRS